MNLGAAITTLASEVVWLTMAAYFLHRHVVPLTQLLRPTRAVIQAWTRR